MAERNTDPVFNVTWTNRNETFADGLAQLYQDGKQVDLTMTADGKQLFAHRSVLSIMSPTIKLLLKEYTEHSRESKPNINKYK